MLYSRLFQCLVVVILSVTISDTLAQSKPPTKPAPTPAPTPTPTPSPKKPKPQTPPQKTECQSNAFTICVADLNTGIGVVGSHSDSKPGKLKGTTTCVGTNRVRGTPPTNLAVCCGQKVVEEINKKKASTKKWKDFCALPGGTIPNFVAKKTPAKAPKKL